MNTIILTGGTNQRFGSEKYRAEIAGQGTLLEILVSNLKSEKIIIVGPECNVAAIYVMEEPPLSGPVNAIAAGLRMVDSELVAIFATDMPFAPKLMDVIMKAFIADAAIPVDDNGVPQPLAAIYRVSSLRRALDSLPNLINQSMKNLIARLEVNLVNVDSRFLLDIDTQDDLRNAHAF